MEEAFDGPYGGTAFALPINYDTDRYDADGRLHHPHFQGLIQYTFSHFSDNNQLRHAALSDLEYGGAVSAVGGLFDAAQQ
jgi:hypothetical protein